MCRADFDIVAEKLPHWGRWGADDQRGTLTTFSRKRSKPRRKRYGQVRYSAWACASTRTAHSWE